MLHSKFFWIAIAVFVIGGALLVVIKRGGGKDQLVEDAIAIIKQGDDRTRDCEAFDRLVAFSQDSKRATLMVAEMYARGMCKPFDLEKSVTWYQKANLPSVEIGQALLQAAEWEIPPDGKKGPSKDQLVSLLSKSKEFGYKPSKSELDRLSPEYAVVFQ